MNALFVRLLLALISAGFLQGNSSAKDEGLPKFVSIVCDDGSHYIKVCHVVDNEAMALVVSYAPKGEEISLPKFGFAKTPGGNSKLTEIRLVEGGSDMRMSRKWFVIHGKNLIAEGIIKFDLTLLQKVMLSRESPDKIIHLLRHGTKPLHERVRGR